MPTLHISLRNRKGEIQIEKGVGYVTRETKKKPAKTAKEKKKAKQEKKKGR